MQLTRRLLLLVPLLAALPAQAQDQAQDRLKVVTTFTVIADMARNVAGEGVDVVSVTKPGAEIHGYEPTPKDIVAASDADLILRNGLGLERWFEQFLANLGEVPSATLTDGIQPISISGGAPTEPCSRNHAVKRASSGRRWAWRKRLGTKLRPSTSPALAVNTMSGTSSPGAIRWIFAERASAACSVSHCRCACAVSARSTCACIHGLIT